MDARPFAACAVALFFLTLPASAQEAPEEDEPSRVVKEVTAVASRVPEAPASAVVRVVTRAEIAAMPDVHAVADVLRSVLGADVRSRRSGGIQADVGIRGSEAGGTLVLVDGQPVSDPQSGRFNLDVDVPLAAVERIEVLAGPGSSVWGSGAIGGAVNVVTRGAALGRANVQLEGRYTHGTQSLDEGGARLALRVAEPVSVAVDWWRAETSGFRDDTESAADAVRLSSRWDTTRGPVTLGLGFASRTFGAYGFYGAAFPDQREWTRTRTASLGASLAVGGFTLTPSILLRTHHDDVVLDRADLASDENVHDTTSATFRLAAARALLGGTVAFGAEGGRDGVHSTSLGDHGRSRGALFAEWARPWDPAAPDGGGVRVSLRADAIETAGSRLSPYVGATLRVAPGVLLHGSFGTAFRAPTFTELYARDPQSQGDPGLAPETAWTLDAGVRVVAGPIDVDAAWYHRDATNLIDFVRTDPDSAFRARNVREAVTDGIEGSLSWARGRPPFLAALSVQAAWIFTDLAALSAAAGGATEGRYVLDPLHVKADLLAAAALPVSLGLSARVTYLSRPSFADGVFLLAGRLSWQAYQGNVLELFVEGANLGNVTYQDVPGVPLPGRTAAAGVKLTW